MIRPATPQDIPRIIDLIKELSDLRMNLRDEILACKDRTYLNGGR